MSFSSEKLDASALAELLARHDEPRAAAIVYRIAYLRRARAALGYARQDLEWLTRYADDEARAAGNLESALAWFTIAEYWREQARGLTEDVRRRRHRQRAA